MTQSPPGRGSVLGLFERFSHTVTRGTGSPAAFIVAIGVILAWAVTGPIFGFSDTWQLVINTGTTVITFLMVFVIQQSQNKQGLALQLKLNELIAAEKYASNRLIDVEDLTEQELEQIHTFYKQLSILTKKETSLNQSHSVEEAMRLAKKKAQIKD